MTERLEKTKKTILLALPLLAWGLTFLVFVQKLSGWVFDLDLWWHLAAGREMVRSLSILKTEIFSHTLYGAEWINFEWLGQIFFYGVFSVFGMTGIFWLKMILSLTSICLLGMSLRWENKRSFVFLLLVWVGFFVVSPRLFERIELLTLVFLPLFVCFFLKGKDGVGVWRVLTPWVLSALMILWCNIHGGFVYGLGVNFLLMVGARWAHEEKGYIRMLDQTLVLMLAAVFVNPYGYKLFVLMVELFLKVREMGAVINEWRGPGIMEYPAFLGLCLVMGFVLLWHYLRGDKRKAKLWLPLILPFLVWGWISSRNMAVFAFVALPALSDFLSSFFAGKRYRFFQAETMRLVGWFFLFCYVAIQSRCLVSPVATGYMGFSRVPSGACDFVKTYHVKGKMFNVYDDGGFISWALGPDKKIFCDGRYLFLPLLKEQNQLFKQAMETYSVNVWKKFFEKNQIDLAVLRYYMLEDMPFSFVSSGKKSPYPLYLFNLMFPRSDWAMVYWDDFGLVFMKRKAENKSFIQEHEYRYLWPYNLLQMRYLVRSGQVSREDVFKELDRHRQAVEKTLIAQKIEDMLDRKKTSVLP